MVTDPGEPVRSFIAESLLPNVQDLTAELKSAWVRDVFDRRVPGGLVDQALATLARSVVVETIRDLPTLSADARNALSPALVLARTMCSRDVPASQIERVFHVAQRWLLDLLLEQLRATKPTPFTLDVAQEIVSWHLLRFEFLSESVTAECAYKREEPADLTPGALLEAVTFVLERVDDDSVAQELLDYPMDARHIGVVLWSRRGVTPGKMLVPLVRGLTNVNGVRDVLVVPRDRISVHAWLSVSGSVSPLANQIARRLGGITDVRMAFGESGEGLEGFKKTHGQALAAQRVAHLPGSIDDPWIRYRDVAPTSLLSLRPELVEPWVALVLGELGKDGEELTRLRETLRVYLEVGENASAAAARLYVHRNTVKYRVARAAELLSVSLEQNRLSVGMALNYRRWGMPQ